MKQQIFPWGDTRRFSSYTGYFKKIFGSRIQKLTLNAGFTCPNRDGHLGTRGCSFCNNDAFNPSYCTSEKSISQQIREGMEFHRVRYRRSQIYLAYFQAYSNTYASVSKLQELYGEALSFPEIKGLVIGTRPDCINQDILQYLEDLSKKVYLIIEYGIESCYDRTLKRINRGHVFADTVNAITLTSERRIRTGGHVIIGLPGESREDIVREADILSALPLNNIKFHQLQIVKDTAMAEEFVNDPSPFTEYDIHSYLDLMVDVTERLNPSFIIERIAGEAHPDYNLRPSWKMRYDQILQLFEKKLEERDTWQGKYYKTH